MTDKQTNLARTNASVPDDIATDSPHLPLDPERYRQHLNDFELTAEEEQQYLQALWQIMVQFVDIGFGVNSIHNLFPHLFGISQDCEENPIESKSDSALSQHFNTHVPAIAQKGESDEPSQS